MQGPLRAVRALDVLGLDLPRTSSAEANRPVGPGAHPPGRSDGERGARPGTDPFSSFHRRPFPRAVHARRKRTSRLPVKDDREPGRRKISPRRQDLFDVPESAPDDGGEKIDVDAPLRRGAAQSTGRKSVCVESACRNPTASRAARPPVFWSATKLRIRELDGPRTRPRPSARELPRERRPATPRVRGRSCGPRWSPRKRSTRRALRPAPRSMTHAASSEARIRFVNPELANARSPVGSTASTAAGLW